MSVEAVIAAFDKQHDVFLEDLLTFLRFQTISAGDEHAEDLRACTQWIQNQLASAGLQAEVISTDGHPVVYADSGPVEDGPTLLFYGHYDVQPIGDAQLWNTPAFEPTIREGVIYARGSADDKGQIMTQLAAVRSWRLTNKSLPVRVKFLIEGEEEIGSPNLPTFVKENKDRLACDYVVISDTAKFDADTPALTCSSRGLVYKEITVEGPERDLHSGRYGGAVANPANVLAKIIASLHDEQQRITIAGFYDDVLPLSDKERDQLSRNAHSDAELLANTGSTAAFGEVGYTTTERYAARPTLDVNGLTSGYTGQGAATIIPAKATAKVSMRLVANQDPEKISVAFDEAVRKACPSSVRLRIETLACCAAYMAPTDSPGMQAAAQALKASFGKPAVLTREGGTLPILPMFKQILGADSVMLGFAMPNCNLHSPNEFFCIRDFKMGTRCIIRFLGAMSRAKP